MLIDTHAHLNDERLLPLADQIVSDMAKDNLCSIIDVGYDRPSSETVFEQVQKYEKVFGVVGIHPHDSKLACINDYDRFKEMSKHKKIVAIGEIGLDYFYDLSDRETQKRVFAEQMELADTLNLPIVIHLRDAYGDLLEILKQNTKYLNNGVLLHCYSGSLDMLKVLAKWDCYFAYGGAITFKNAKKEEIVRATPIDRLLLETDCPYMTPVPYRGQTNLPAYVNIVASRIKEWLSEVDLETITTNNAKRFFRINDNNI